MGNRCLIVGIALSDLHVFRPAADMGHGYVSMSSAFCRLSKTQQWPRDDKG